MLRGCEVQLYNVAFTLEQGAAAKSAELRIQRPPSQPQSPPVAGQLPIHCRDDVDIVSLFSPAESFQVTSFAQCVGSAGVSQILCPIYS